MGAFCLAGDPDYAGWVFGSFDGLRFAFVAHPKSDRLCYGIAAGELNREGQPQGVQ